METCTCSPEEVATPDWEAIQHLQERTRQTKRSFEQDAIDKAIDALLDRPKRLSSGKRLADNAFATARKSLRRRKLPLGAVVELEAGCSGCTRTVQGQREPLPVVQQPETERSQCADPISFWLAYSLLLKAFAALCVKERRAVLVDADARFGSVLSMPIKDRQRRNIRRRAQSRFGRKERDAVLVLVEQAVVLRYQVSLLDKLILLAAAREPSWEASPQVA